jgi:SET domain-containing protein
MRSMTFGMKVPDTCSLSPVIRVPGSQSRRTRVKKVRKNYYSAKNELYSFNQPMCYRYKWMAGVIEYLDIIQGF